MRESKKESIINEKEAAVKKNEEVKPEKKNEETAAEKQEQKPEIKKEEVKQEPKAQKKVKNTTKKRAASPLSDRLLPNVALSYYFALLLNNHMS